MQPCAEHWSVNQAENASRAVGAVGNDAEASD